MLPNMQKKPLNGGLPLTNKIEDKSYSVTDDPCDDVAKEISKWICVKSEKETIFIRH